MHRGPSTKSNTSSWQHSFELIPTLSGASPLPSELHQMTYARADGTNGSGLSTNDGDRMVQQLIEPGAENPIGRKLIQTAYIKR